MLGLQMVALPEKVVALSEGGTLEEMGPWDEFIAQPLSSPLPSLTR